MCGSCPSAAPFPPPFHTHKQTSTSSRKRTCSNICADIDGSIFAICAWSAARCHIHSEGTHTHTPPSRRHNHTKGSAAITHTRENQFPTPTITHIHAPPPLPFFSRHIHTPLHMMSFSSLILSLSLSHCVPAQDSCVQTGRWPSSTETDPSLPLLSSKRGL